MLKATSHPHIFEVGRVDPIPALEEALTSPNLKQADSLDHHDSVYHVSHDPFLAMARDTFPKVAASLPHSAFMTTSWWNTHLQDHRFPAARTSMMWHQDNGEGGMLLAILANHPYAGTQFTDTYHTIPQLEVNEGELIRKAWTADAKVLDETLDTLEVLRDFYFPVTFQLRPWILYLITRRLYHRVPVGCDHLNRIMFRIGRFPYQLDYPDLDSLTQWKPVKLWWEQLPVRLCDVVER